MEITYRMQEGFQIPNLLLPQETEVHLGKYAELRRQYLIKHRRVLYINLKTSGKLAEHLAEIEESGETEGVLVLINTVGGDVSCGLALAEMIASLSKPTVSLVIGDSHSIGVPLAVAVDHSFIVPTGTMMVHPVQMTGMVIGSVQTYDYFEMIQDRILSFVSGHSQISYERLRSLMLNTELSLIHI